MSNWFFSTSAKITHCSPSSAETCLPRPPAAQVSCNPQPGLLPTPSSLVLCTPSTPVTQLGPQLHNSQSCSPTPVTQHSLIAPKINTSGKKHPEYSRKVFVFWSDVFVSALTGAPCVIADNSAALPVVVNSPSIPALSGHSHNLSLQLAAAAAAATPSGIPTLAAAAASAQQAPLMNPTGTPPAAALSFPSGPQGSHPLVEQLLANAAQAYHAQLAINS